MNLFKILYPDRCPLCDEVRMLNETGICFDCEKNLVLIDEPTCPGCGRPVKENGRLCEACVVSTLWYDGGKSVYAYSSLCGSIYRFKYMNRPSYANALAKLIVKEAGYWIGSINPDAIIPVPLNKKRLIHRGYNQATELAAALSDIVNIPMYDNIALRIRDTVPQKLVAGTERAANVKNAFIVQENVVKFNKIILIDDIFTTGSTINSLAKAFKDAGVGKVYFLTLCRAGI